MPSSPLLVAMRDAVDSLNKYEDFKILEKIGAGFFAEVYKVSLFSWAQIMIFKPGFLALVLMLFLASEVQNAKFGLH